MTGIRVVFGMQSKDLSSKTLLFKVTLRKVQSLLQEALGGMFHRYYTLEVDWLQLECEVHNPKWSELRSVASRNWHEPDTSKVDFAWGLRFYELTRDPQQRQRALEYLKTMYGWHEALNSGTFLVLRRGYPPLPDAGRCSSPSYPLDVHVISPRAKIFLENIGLQDELEFEGYPLYTADRTTPLGTYYCVRYLVHLECVDESRSFVEREPFPFYRWQLVLKKAMIGVHRIFLVTNFETKMVIVRSDVKEAIEQAGLTGFEFHREVETV